MLGYWLDTISLVTFFIFLLLSYNLSLLSEIYFYLLYALTLSKSERASNQGIYMDTVKNIVRNAEIWKNTKYYFLNRMEYIEDSLVKSSG